MVVSLRQINKIILHCSDSEWGDAAIIDKWHRERGWQSCGYHFVILNGCRTYDCYSNDLYNKQEIGLVEDGRPVEIIGAHVGDYTKNGVLYPGMNKDSIGVCLIGVKDFHPDQMSSAVDFVYGLTKEYNVEIHNVQGHYETPSGQAQGKTCPNFNLSWFRFKLLWKKVLDKIKTPLT